MLTMSFERLESRVQQANITDLSHPLDSLLLRNPARKSVTVITDQAFEQHNTTQHNTTQTSKNKKKILQVTSSQDASEATEVDRS
jgi:hypothetical protein